MQLKGILSVTKPELRLLSLDPYPVLCRSFQRVTLHLAPRLERPLVGVLQLRKH